MRRCSAAPAPSIFIVAWTDRVNIGRPSLAGIELDGVADLAAPRKQHASP
jgi:hypothetical protein